MADEPAWFVQPGEDEQWDVADPSDWTELAAMEQPGSGGSYARDDASETLVGHIPAAKKYDARRKILGYAWADSDSFKLRRVNPLPHPDEEQLRAVTVDMAGYNPRGTEREEGDDEDEPTYVVRDASRSAGVSGTFPRRVNYTRLLATVKFRPHPFPFLSDEQIDAMSLPEYYRNCVIFDSCDPILEVVAAGAEGFLRWADHPSGTTDPPYHKTNGLEKGEIPLFISKANLVMLWVNVPLDYIAADYLPSKIMDCVGKVNDEDDWLAGTSPGTGFPRGTLKLEAPKFKASVQGHIRTTPAYQIPKVVDVMLPFTFVDPEPGAVTEPNPKFAGHNLFPWAKSAKFYSVERTQRPAVGLFEYSAFESIFTHVLS